MSLRLNWLLLIFIYLSVNGQIFAAPIHMCSAMVLSSNVFSMPPKALNIHEHHQKTKHHVEGEHKSMTSDMQNSKTMANCQCIDCDCIKNISGQANLSFIQGNNLTDFLPVISKASVKLIQYFISQPHTNLYRPPIFI